jgi:hypothetical protein
MVIVPRFGAAQPGGIYLGPILASAVERVGFLMIGASFSYAPRK